MFLFMLLTEENPFDSVDGYLGLFWFVLPFVVVISAIIIGLLNRYEIIVLKTFQYFLPLNQERVDILNKSFPYYQKLSSRNQRRFRNRVHHFLINKKIESTEYDVTEEMRVLIAGTAIQILFGLEPYYLSYFGNINLVVDQIDNNFTTKKSPIHISWVDFHEGHSFLTSGYNPGLRILSVAFKLEQGLNEISKHMFLSNRHYEFNMLYKREAEKYISSGKASYDDYSDVDRNEYFGVAVEYFFERPIHFQANQPAMYEALSRLLQQDPLGKLKYKRS
jgi:Mlc titration factor MtfA (ptsG expression regulator)